MSDAGSGPGRDERRSRRLMRTVLGEVLRRIRHAQQRTLAEVAATARVSLPYLSEVERGRKEASSEVLWAIADALGVELAEILVEVGRDLHAEAARPAPVLRLDQFRQRRAAAPAPGAALRPGGPRPGGPGDVVCLLAA